MAPEPSYGQKALVVVGGGVVRGGVETTVD